MRNVLSAAAALVFTIAMSGVAPDARASLMIEVSQESSAGAGNFDANVLGFIDPFSTGQTIAGFYQYGNPNFASYNGELNGGPSPISSLTQGFFVEASDGLHYVVVHDNPNDGSGGNSSMTTTLIGGAGGGAAFTVEDDLGDATSVSDVASDRIFGAVVNWLNCCTDGYAIGSLLGSNVLYAQFDAVPTGIDSWRSTGNAQPDIAMVIAPERRVRYQLISVPEPATIMLMGLGLVGLGLARRKLKA